MRALRREGVDLRRLGLRIDQPHQAATRLEVLAPLIAELLDKVCERPYGSELFPDRPLCHAALPFYGCQPCASRTAIIAARMLFHVSRFIIVSLGNMQPSQ